MRNIDDLVQGAATRLARGQTRRRFFGGVGLGAATLGSAGLLHGAADAHEKSSAGTARCGHDGCYDDDAVDVCYRPWYVLSNAAVRVGPSSSAPQISTIYAGKTFGRQSTRNPFCSHTPPLRGDDNGYVWGYIATNSNDIDKGLSGWVALSQLSDNPGWGGTACGPCCDFDCRKDPGVCGGHCQNAADPAASSVSGRRVVTAREAYLRYAPGSTPYRYLVANDTVDRLCLVNDGWTCVQVASARWAPAGARGWVQASSLG